MAMNHIPHRDDYSRDLPPQRRLTDKVTLKHLQDTQPWTVPYSIHMTSAPAAVVQDRMGAHVVLHAAKTVGKLAALFETVDHTGNPITDGQVDTIRDMAADLVTEAMRLANLYGFDLAANVVQRSEEKNGVTLPAWPGQYADEPGRRGW